MDYEKIISEKFPNTDIEVIKPDFFEIDQLLEYITDDIVIRNPYSIYIYRHLIRFFMNVGLRGKIYYLDGFSDEEIKIIHEGILKFTFRRDTKIKLFENSNPDEEVLDL